MSAWEITFRAIDPKAPTQTWATGVRASYLKRLRDHGHQTKLVRLLLVKEILEGGAVEIRRGGSHMGAEDYYVYVGRPDRDWRSETIETPAPPEMVFLVFVLKDGTIDEWTWRPFEGNQPQGLEGEVVWSLAQS